MNVKQLEKNIMDMMKEQQLKLGYLHETVRLYYPASSIRSLLETDCSDEELLSTLNTFFSLAGQTLGAVNIHVQDDRFCFSIPPEGADYVHAHLDEEEFIAVFIRAIKEHRTLEELFDIFHGYSDRVHIEKMTDNEFDYLVYFEDGIPDSYRYCLTQEGNHITYHRFTEHDYRMFH